MSPKELNRDIKRLNKKVIKMYSGSLTDQDIYNQIETDIRKEYTRLYNSDSKFEYMNKKSILIMLRLNVKLRFVALHSFGIHVNLEDL